MSSTTTPKFRVAIIGAGLGGLVHALLLQKNNQDSEIQVDIYEGASELAEIGAGVGMWPRITEIMRYLGVEEDLLQITGDVHSGAMPVCYRKADQKEPIQFLQLENILHSFHRAELQKVFAKHLRVKDSIHFSKRLTTYIEPKDASAPIALHFKDGTTATCDILIGSDGIHSAVRRTMYGEFAAEARERGDQVEAERLQAKADPVWSGQIVYRALVPVEKLARSAYVDVGSTLILLGKNKNIVTFPVSRGTTINAALFVTTPGAEGAEYEGPWVTETTAEKVAQEFSTWSDDVRDLIGAMEKPLSWAIHIVPDLPTFVKGRVALLGDAAHAMTPHQGAGVGQAIEDGFILATILAHETVCRQHTAEALKIYDEIRRPFALGVQKGSSDNGERYQLRRLGWESVTPEQSSAGGFPIERLQVVGEELQKQARWAREDSIMPDHEKALEMLERL